MLGRHLFRNLELSVDSPPATGAVDGTTAAPRGGQTRSARLLRAAIATALESIRPLEIGMGQPLHCSRLQNQDARDRFTRFPGSEYAASDVEHDAVGNPCELIHERANARA